MSAPAPTQNTPAEPVPDAGGFRVLLCWRWAGLVALAAVLVATCIWLGDWQLGRYEQRAAANDRIAAATQQEPVDITTVMTVDQAPATADEWSRASASGEFDPSGETLIRNRSLDGQNGYEVITPLLLRDGTAVLIDRGWVPADAAGATQLPDVPAPPAGEVTITGRVRASESELGAPNQVEGVRQARSINVEQLTDTLDYPVLAGYLSDEDPKGLTAVPIIEQNSWQNFAYAYQWWLFAVMIPVGLILLARREVRPSAPKARNAALGPKPGESADDADLM